MKTTKKEKKNKLSTVELLEKLGLGKDKYCFKCGAELIDGGIFERNTFDTITGKRHKFRVEKCPKYNEVWRPFHTNNNYLHYD